MPRRPMNVLPALDARAAANGRVFVALGRLRCTPPEFGRLRQFSGRCERGFLQVEGGLMNQLKKVATGKDLACLAGKYSGSDANTRSAVAMLLDAQAGGLA